MKNSLMHTTLSVSLLCFSTLVASEPTVYGKANVSLNMHDDEINNVDNWQLNSNASRLGIKGNMPLDNNLEAVYQFEYEVAIDDGEQGIKVQGDCDDDDSTTSQTCKGTGSTFKQRNIFVGIRGDFGQVIAGKHETPFKLSQGKADRFNDLPLGDINSVLTGENRVDNIVIYTSPEMNGIVGNLAFIPGEDVGTTASDNNGAADSFSGALKYGQDAFWVALAIDSEVNGMDASRLTVEYTFDKAKLAVLLQSSEDIASTIESSGHLVSGQYALNDRWVVKGQYVANTVEDITASSSPEINTTMLTAGIDYKLAKKAKLFAYASSLDMEQGTNEATQSTVGLGAEVKF